MNIQNGIGTDLTQLIIQQTRGLLDAVAQKVSLPDSLSDRGSRQDTAKASFGGVMDDALNLHAKGPNAGSNSPARAESATATPIAPSQGLEQIGTILAILLLKGDLGVTDRDPAAPIQSANRTAEDPNNSAQAEPNPSAKPKPGPWASEPHQGANANDTAIGPHYPAANPGAASTHNGAPQPAATPSPVDQFSGLSRNEATGYRIGYYPPGTPKPEAVSREYDWVYTDIGWELHPNEYNTLLWT